MAVLLVRAAVDTLHRQGLFAALRYGASAGRRSLRGLFGPQEPQEHNIVDDQFGTDTAGTVKLYSLDIRSPNYQYGVHYQPTELPVIAAILGRLTLRHEEYTFIDYGSGKGLVLLSAAAYPFKRVIGVEFAPELYQTAQRNIQTYPAHLRRSEIELVHGDAVDYTPPGGNLVLYLYEPFEVPVTRQVIRRIEEFRHGRDVFVAFTWSTKSIVSSKSLWDSTEFLATVAEGDCWTIYHALS
jgi:SAM-dependent methyltransferase